MPSNQPKLITAQGLWQAFVDAGIFREDEGGEIRRVVIDIDVDKTGVVMYVERWADERLLEVVPALTGVEIRQRAASA